MMRPRFTNAGRELQLRALAGVELIFTKMQLGDGELGDTDYQTLNALISPKATLSLSAIKISDGSATIRGAFSNRNMIEGFDYRELGLFAKDPDDPEKEILYCYANFGNEYQHIAEPSSALIERTVRINVTVDDAPNVSAVINDSAMYVDHMELMRILEKHNTSESAHANMLDFDVTFYIDSTTKEDADLRTGEYDHPFMTIQEAADAIPLSALRVNLILKTGGATYVGLDDDYIFKAFHAISVVYDGDESTRPIVAGHLRFDKCNNVEVKNISMTAAAATTLTDPENLGFQNCSHVNLNTVRGTLLDDNCIFISARGSTLVIRNMVAVSAYRALQAAQGAKVYLMDSTITGGSIGISSVYGAEVHVVNNVNNTAITRTIAMLGGIIFDTDIASDISSGTVHQHLNDENNPHEVSLDQAQQKGGTVDVPHGGTGNKTFDVGALLKGNGDSALSQLLGIGALFASEYGEPQFGTLPISLGGTGMTSDGTYLQSSTTNGVKHGSVKLPGGIVIMWGKIDTAGQRTYEHSFTQYHKAKFGNGDYVFVFSGQDDVWKSVTKNADSFAIEVGGIAAGSYVADWIAIGMGG